jgi:hypothetical protein
MFIWIIEGGNPLGMFQEVVVATTGGRSNECEGIGGGQRRPTINSDELNRREPHIPSKDGGIDGTPSRGGHQPQVTQDVAVNHAAGAGGGDEPNSPRNGRVAELKG